MAFSLLLRFWKGHRQDPFQIKQCYLWETDPLSQSLFDPGEVPFLSDSTADMLICCSGTIWSPADNSVCQQVTLNPKWQPWFVPFGWMFSLSLSYFLAFSLFHSFSLSHVMSESCVLKTLGWINGEKRLSGWMGLSLPGWRCIFYRPAPCYIHPKFIQLIVLLHTSTLGCSGFPFLLSLIHLWMRDGEIFNCVFNTFNNVPVCV